MNKDFHIIIVTYNRVNYLKNCIKSVLKQKKVSIYLDIIDNGSVDNTKEYLRKFRNFQNERIIINQ